MKRTQVYLKESQKKELGLLAEQKGKSLAELVRETVDMYIVDNRSSADKSILQTSGLWKSRDDIPDSVRMKLSSWNFSRNVYEPIQEESWNQYSRCNNSGKPYNSIVETHNKLGGAYYGNNFYTKGNEATGRSKNT